MKKIYLLISILYIQIGFSQAVTPASPYYDGFDWTQTGTALKNALDNILTSKHTKKLTYGEAENSIKITDLDPTDNTNTNVLLLYGFDNFTICNYVNETTFGTTSNSTEHRRRHKEADEYQGSLQNPDTKYCEWNREHVFAKSLGVPKLDDGGISDAGEDAHHIRSSDVVRNADRASLKFATGSGNSGFVSGGWYPGDEWKGDVARMMMYMYLRYDNQCLTTFVGTGSTATSDANMVNLFLQWNAEDPVSEYEDNRNTYHGNTTNSYAQGNRNPFIDNPYLATLIWGGPSAQNRWPTVILSNPGFDLASTISVYPNPSNESRIYISSENSLDTIDIININGQIIQQIKQPKAIDNQYTLENLPKGFYFLKVSSENNFATKKIIIN
jgi:endonuclease I